MKRTKRLEIKLVCFICFTNRKKMLAWYYIMIIVLVVVGLAGFLIYWFAFHNKPHSGSDKDKDQTQVKLTELLQVGTDPIGNVTSIIMSGERNRGYVFVENVGGFNVSITKTQVQFSPRVYDVTSGAMGSFTLATVTNNNTSIASWNGSAYLPAGGSFPGTAFAVLDASSSNRNCATYENKTISIHTSANGSDWEAKILNAGNPSMNFVRTGLFIGEVLYVIDVSFQIFKLDGSAFVYVGSVWDNISNTPQTDNSAECSVSEDGTVLFFCFCVGGKAQASSRTGTARFP
jgi:hypothetical protein